MRTRPAQVLLLLGGVQLTAAVTLAYQNQPTPSAPDLSPLWVGGFACIILAFFVDAAWFRDRLQQIPLFWPPTTHVAEVISKGNDLAGRVHGSANDLDADWIAAVDEWRAEADAVVAKHARWYLPGFRNADRMAGDYANVPAWAQNRYGAMMMWIGKLAELQKLLDRR